MNDEELLEILKEISDKQPLRDLESRVTSLELAQIRTDLHNELAGPLATLDRIANRR